MKKNADFKNYNAEREREQNRSYERRIGDYERPGDGMNIVAKTFKTEERERDGERGRKGKEE